MLYQSWAHSYYRDNGQTHPVHCCSVHNIQETAYLSTKWLDKENMVHLYNGILFSYILSLAGLFLGQTTWLDLGTLYLLKSQQFYIAFWKYDMSPHRTNQTSTLPFSFIKPTYWPSHSEHRIICDDGQQGYLLGDPFQLESLQDSITSAAEATDKAWVWWHHPLDFLDP